MNKREQQVRKYLDEFLQDKSEEKRAEFLAKDFDKQYASIMQWKRRRIAHAALERPTVDDIISEMKCTAIHIGNLENLSEKDSAKIKRQLDKLNTALADYHQNVMMKKLLDLKRQRAELDRRISEMES